MNIRKQKVDLSSDARCDFALIHTTIPIVPTKKKCSRQILKCNGQRCGLAGPIRYHKLRSLYFPLDMVILKPELQSQMILPDHLPLVSSRLRGEVHKKNTKLLLLQSQLLNTVSVCTPTLSSMPKAYMISSFVKKKKCVGESALYRHHKT